MTRPRVAIAHDYLTQRGGAERVVASISRAFPDATIYTTLYNPESTFPEFADATIVTSPAQRVAAFRQDHRLALPLLPYAVSRMHIDADLVIASSSGWAHGMTTSGRKLVYCHAPARWLYQAENYLGGSRLGSARGWGLLTVGAWLRGWDRRAAASADRYVVNSRVIQARVEDAYGIQAAVLPPPVGVDRTGEHRPVPQVSDWAEKGYHLLVSRLLPYKNVDQAIEAFRGLPERLVIVGAGPLHDQLHSTLPSNIVLLSDLEDASLRWLYANATALVAPSHEDFGLGPIEAAAFGKPTIALRAGGYLDTVDEAVNGHFFSEPVAAAIREAVVASRARSFDPDAIRLHADYFSEANFHERLRQEVDDLLQTATPLTPPVGPSEKSATG